MCYVCSCEAFKLVNPPKKPIRDILIKSNQRDQLEDLLRYVRRNIFQIPETLSNINIERNMNEIKENNLESLSSTTTNDNLSLEYEIFSEKLNESTTNNEEYGLDINESLERFLCEDETITNRPLELRINRRDKRTFTKESLRNNKTSLVDSLTLLNVPNGTGSNLLEYNAKETIEETEIDDDTDFVQVAQTLK